MYDVYQKCPIFSNEIVTLRLTSTEDAEELLNCYSDEAAVPIFNSDNCHGDDFHYTSLEQMKKEVEFWQYSYDSRWFVRMTIILNATNEKIGAVEMFNRDSESIYGSHGVLRIDLMSKYERENIISAVLDLADKHFFTAFDVGCILTKAIPVAEQRIAALKTHHYLEAEDFEVGSNYFVKHLM